MITFAREALGIPGSTAIELSPLGRRGSDRAFFRLNWGRGESAILIHYDPKYVENAYYADIGTFLYGIELSVPRLIRHDPVRCLIVMEDLGDTDLWSLRGSPWENRRPLYEKTLVVIHKLHSFPEKDFPADHVKLMEPFGLEFYRWEQDHFREQFVRDFCGIEIEPASGRELETELSTLAGCLSGTVPCLVHRDLQSQNVMIRGGVPFLIDFQGMRFGSLFYDLGSLLCDPYVEFEDHQRMEMLLYYYGLSKRDAGWKEFQKMFWEASVQRLMQALGAYGFLGLKKGLNAFLKHIPSGLRNLHHAAQRVKSLPRLQELVRACQNRISLRISRGFRET
jgi:aminoglycoside/choline kinase family phosphotransferase